MSGANSNVLPVATGRAPQFHEGPVHIKDDVHLRLRYHTYRTSAGLVIGADFNIMFTIDRPAKDVWPHLKDFNRWQNSYGYYYSGVVGDLEGETFSLSLRKPNEPVEEYPYRYKVVRVIPEYLIVADQPVPEDGSNGGISPGFHVFMLNEHDGKTVVTIVMEHAMRTPDMTEEQALDSWRKETPEALRFWRDIFIPTLKKLVHEGK